MNKLFKKGAFTNLALVSFYDIFKIVHISPANNGFDK